MQMGLTTLIFFGGEGGADAGDWTYASALPSELYPHPLPTLI